VNSDLIAQLVDRQWSQESIWALGSRLARWGTRSRHRLLLLKRKRTP